MNLSNYILVRYLSDIKPKLIPCDCCVTYPFSSIDSFVFIFSTTEVIWGLYNKLSNDKH